MAGSRPRTHSASSTEGFPLISPKIGLGRSSLRSFHSPDDQLFVKTPSLHSSSFASRFTPSPSSLHIQSQESTSFRPTPLQFFTPSPSFVEKRTTHIYPRTMSKSDKSPESTSPFHSARRTVALCGSQQVLGSNTTFSSTLVSTPVVSSVPTHHKYRSQSAPQAEDHNSGSAFEMPTLLEAANDAEKEDSISCRHHDRPYSNGSDTCPPTMVPTHSHIHNTRRNLSISPSLPIGHRMHSPLLDQNMLKTPSPSPNFSPACATPQTFPLDWDTSTSPSPVFTTTPYPAISNPRGMSQTTANVHHHSRIDQRNKSPRTEPAKRRKKECPSPPSRQRIFVHTNHAPNIPTRNLNSLFQDDLLSGPEDQLEDQLEDQPENDESADSILSRVEWKHGSPPNSSFSLEVPIPSIQEFNNNDEAHSNANSPIFSYAKLFRFPEDLDSPPAPSRTRIPRRRVVDRTQLSSVNKTFLSNSLALALSSTQICAHQNDETNDKSRQRGTVLYFPEILDSHRSETTTDQDSSMEKHNIDSDLDTEPRIQRSLSDILFGESHGQTETAQLATPLILEKWYSPESDSIPVLSIMHKELHRLHRIGKGSFSKVYKCKHSSGKNFAVKRTKHSGYNRIEWEHFHRESKAHQILGCHPHIVKLERQWLEPDGTLHMQFELCQQGDVYHALQMGCSFSQDQVLLFGKHVALALHHLHQNGFAHLDVKPENVFVDADGRIKLGDLGLCIQWSEGEKSDLEGDSKYLCRERLSGKVCSLDKVDIFALGMSMYELAVGASLPGDGVSWNKLRDEPLPPLQCLSNDCLSLIQSMVDVNPSCRPTASEFLCHPLVTELQIDCIFI